MTYSPKNYDSVLIRWPAHFHDEASNPELTAQVASNDYFALLATQIDTVSQSLKQKQLSDYVVLESVIDDLLYLNKHYVIRKK